MADQNVEISQSINALNASIEKIPIALDALKQQLTTALKENNTASIKQLFDANKQQLAELVKTAYSNQSNLTSVRDISREIFTNIFKNFSSNKSNASLSANDKEAEIKEEKIRIREEGQKVSLLGINEETLRKLQFTLKNGFKQGLQEFLDDNPDAFCCPKPTSGSYRLPEPERPKPPVPFAPPIPVGYKVPYNVSIPVSVPVPNNVGVATGVETVSTVENVTRELERKIPRELNVNEGRLEVPKPIDTSVPQAVPSTVGGFLSRDTAINRQRDEMFNRTVAERYNTNKELFQPKEVTDKSREAVDKRVEDLKVRDILREVSAGRPVYDIPDFKDMVEKEWEKYSFAERFFGKVSKEEIERQILKKLNLDPNSGLYGAPSTAVKDFQELIFSSGVGGVGRAIGAGSEIINLAKAGSKIAGAAEAGTGLMRGAAATGRAAATTGKVAETVVSIPQSLIRPVAAAKAAVQPLSTAAETAARVPGTALPKFFEEVKIIGDAAKAQTAVTKDLAKAFAAKVPATEALPYAAGVAPLFLLGRKSELEQAAPSVLGGSSVTPFANKDQASVMAEKASQLSLVDEQNLPKEQSVFKDITTGIEKLNETLTSFINNVGKGEGTGGSAAFSNASSNKSTTTIFNSYSGAGEEINSSRNKTDDMIFRYTLQYK